MDGTAEEPAERAEAIRLEKVGKTYPDGTVAVAELDLAIPEGELVCLIGPSGCGKTTTMKMINRLVEPTTGRILLGDEDVTGVDPVQLRRRIGYVIQQVGLFAHETIADNVGTVPKLLGWDRKRTRARVGELLELVGLDPDTFAKRYPAQLSGGQRQRVGVARALAADPPVLLMDEPFSAIDPIARARLQAEFQRIQGEVHKTIVFVTHDVDEAVRLGDRIAVFRQGGHLEQYDTPAQVLGAPASDFVADFVGADRGLRRLAVTGIQDGDLEHPPVVVLDDGVADAKQAMAGSHWAVVLDPSGGLHGWVKDSMLTSGTVKDVARRFDATVRMGASLKDAFAEMLQHDAGWVAVLEGNRYRGVLTPWSLHAALRRSVDSGLGVDFEKPVATY
ncbi:MAG TPA: betaine/proline/choline family ABC transporter ATP-binding protein [Mycobacteriales bacterium]|nr:betaine/proline/choline family ABC transporter ATP-binding protein [Mycobacteriales bacterium]